MVNKILERQYEIESCTEYHSIVNSIQFKRIIFDQVKRIKLNFYYCDDTSKL